MALFGEVLGLFVFVGAVLAALDAARPVPRTRTILLAWLAIDAAVLAFFLLKFVFFVAVPSVFGGQ